MTNFARYSPESFKTIFLRKEDTGIILTEQGRRIVVRRIVPENFRPIRVYEFEKQQNENRREIVLIDKSYRKQVVDEFRKSLRP